MSVYILRLSMKICLLLSALLPFTAVASELYVGFLFGMISRSGIVVGYRVDNENSVEAHFGGLPHNATYGISLKHSNQSKEYLVFGYSALSQWSGHNGTRVKQGLQLGIGRRVDSASGRDWSESIEIVGGPAYDVENKQWSRLLSFGYALNYKEFN